MAYIESKCTVIFMSLSFFDVPNIVRNIVVVIVVVEIVE